MGEEQRKHILCSVSPSVPCMTQDTRQDGHYCFDPINDSSYRVRKKGKYLGEDKIIPTFSDVDYEVIRKESMEGLKEGAMF